MQTAIVRTTIDVLSPDLKTVQTQRVCYVLATLPDDVTEPAEVFGALNKECRSDLSMLADIISSKGKAPDVPAVVTNHCKEVIRQLLANKLTYLEV